MVVKKILPNGSPILDEPAGNNLCIVVADDYNIAVIELSTLTVRLFNTDKYDKFNVIYRWDITTRFLRHRKSSFFHFLRV